MKNLIHYDISRCEDSKCPLSATCARFQQLAIDRHNQKRHITYTDFRGSEKAGKCEYYINIVTTPTLKGAAH